MTVPSSGKCLDCISSFRAAIATLEERGDDKEHLLLIDKTRDELDRFTLWAGNIGALNVPTSPLSLEHRLRDAKDILTHILELLDDLQEATSDRMYLRKAPTFMYGKAHLMPCSTALPCRTGGGRRSATRRRRSR